MPIQNNDKDWNYKIERQHIVPHPNIYSLDHDLNRRMANEACAHSGYKVQYFEAIEESDFYQDKVVTWKDAVVMDCIFDENPKVKILKELGWYNHDSEIQGQIIYLPMYKGLNGLSKDIFSVKDQSLIRVSYFGQNYPVDFRITEKRMDSTYGIFWICKLAPESLDNFEYITSHGSHFLKRRDDAPEECVHDTTEDKDKDERVFQNEDQEKYLINKEVEPVSESRPKYSDIKYDERLSYSQLIMQGGGLDY